MAKPLSDYVPFYKDSKRAANAITNIMHIPCAVPYAVYFEAAAAASWRFAYNIASPDPKEVYHQLIGNSLYHDIKHAAEDTHILSPREDSFLTKGLFLIADVVDVALWYGFLFGSAVDGLVDASTLIQKAGKCPTAQKPNFFQGGPYVNAIPDNGDFAPDLFRGTKGSTPNVVQTAFAQFGFGQNGFIAGSCAFTTFGGGSEVPATTAAINLTTNTILNAGKSGNVGSDHQTLGHAFWKGRNETHVIQQVEIQSSYTGGDPLPLHEAFRDGNKWFGFAFSPL